MNEFEYLLMVLSEECAEVAQRASKVARFGLHEIQPGQSDDNKRRLERELADLMATADLLGFRVREEDKVAKIEKLKKFMAYSREKGTLDDRDKLLLQVSELQKILADAKGMFAHGNSLQGTHAGILFKTIEEYEKKYPLKRICPAMYSELVQCAKEVGHAGNHMRQTGGGLVSWES